MKILKRKALAALLALSLLASLLPLGAQPALAADGDTVYVGGVALAYSESTSVYATTDVDGNVKKEGADADNYNIKWDGSTLTLKDAYITNAAHEDNYRHPVEGAAIGVANSSGAAELTIELESDNTIEDVSLGIWVYSSTTGYASLTIMGNGSLTASVSANSGILVQSNDGNATLSIENAEVTTTSSSSDGVLVRAKDGSNASLTVNGGSLTASGDNGICFWFGSGGSGSGTPNLTVSNNAIVRASGNAGGIVTNSSTATPSGTGIVFDKGIGTVYGSVTLQEDLTISKGESLTLDNGASLTTNNKLTVDGGTLNGTVTGDVLYKVTSVSLDKDSLNLTAGGSDTLIATVLPANATNQTVTWTSDNTAVATVDANGNVSAVAAGTANITATADGKSDSCTVTVLAPTTITTQPSDVSVAEGTSATFTVAVTGNSTLSYQWQQSSDGSSWTDIPDATSASYTVADTTTAMSGNQYRCVVKDGDDNSVTSNAVTLTVTEQPRYQIAVDPAALNFGSIYDDQAAPTAQTVTITNTGNQSVTLTQPTADNYVIGTLSTTTLDPNATATFTVQPKAGLSAGSYEENLTISGTGGTSASVALRFSVRERPYIPPTPPSVSEETIDAILDAEPGETVSVALEDGDTTLDAEVFETLAGQDITLEIALEDGVTWTVNGQDIPADANLDDLDLSVEMNSDGIPVDVVNSITGERDTVQMTLAHDGDFGFTMTLTAPLGAENAGYWANLYHFDEDAERLIFETAAEIDADGSVSLSLSHASQYAIVIDDHSHATIDLPFSDVSDSDWFYDPVVWIYNEGLMTGTSATTFEPNTSTTRAMIVAMLARLEGVESADSAGFTDVSGSDWYATAVNWAASEGIVGGFGDGTFQPNAPITREQMASILYRYAEYKGLDVSARTDLSHYSDQPSVWAEDVLSWAVAEGLLTGVTNDQLQPQGNATRAQVAAILERFLAE